MAAKRRVLAAVNPLRSWRNWQTHQLEGLAVAIPWWFESTRPHQILRGRICPERSRRALLLFLACPLSHSSSSLLFYYIIHELCPNSPTTPSYPPNSTP